MDTSPLPEAPPPPPPAAPAAAGTSSRHAVVALCCGVVSVLGGLVLLIPPILAVVFGHIAVSECNRNRGLGGKGMGIAGLVLGYFSLIILVPGLLAAMAIPAFTKVRVNSQQKAVLGNARQLAAAADQYYLENGVTTVRFDQLVGPTKYIKTFATVTGEHYPERYTLGVTLTIEGVAGTRTVTYVP